MRECRSPSTQVTNSRAHARTRTHAHSHTRARSHACVSTCAQVHIHAVTHRHTHAFTQTDGHTHRYTLPYHTYHTPRIVSLFIQLPHSRIRRSNRYILKVLKCIREALWSRLLSVDTMDIHDLPIY